MPRGGGTTAPSTQQAAKAFGKAKKKAEQAPQSGVAASKPASGQERTGTINKASGLGAGKKQTTNKVKETFARHFESLGQSQKHDLVRRFMQKKYGQTNWQSKVYGKGYKPGTVGKLNTSIQTKKTKQAKVSNALEHAQSELAGADPNAKTAIEAHIAQLHANESALQHALGTAQNSRKHFLTLRDSALKGIAAQAHQDPGALTRGRRKLVKQKVKSEKLKAKTSDGGGTGPA